MKDNKGSIIIAAGIIIGFLMFGLLIRGPLLAIGENLRSDEKQVSQEVEYSNRYQMFRANDCNIIIFDTTTGDYWRKFIAVGEGPTYWEKQNTPFSRRLD